MFWRLHPIGIPRSARILYVPVTCPVVLSSYLCRSDIFSESDSDESVRMA